MTVIERVRELGLLRAAGATRGQLVRFVVTQGALLGVLGSALGAAAGVLLAQVAAAWLRTAGGVTLDGPEITPQILVAAIGAGVGITLVASLEPARRAGASAPSRPSGPARTPRPACVRTRAGCSS